MTDDPTSPAPREADPVLRVWRVIDEGTRVRQDVGTVERVSRAGYTRVRWDDGTTEHFRPHSPEIRVVTGDDALPRHDWGDFRNDDKDASCIRCGVVQSDENEFEACHD